MVRAAADEALGELESGNRRFQNGQACGPRRDDARRRDVAEAQCPKAAILCCSDSRVPPEILFDQGLGDVFVVRTAGHVLGPSALGSLEYAVEHLHVPLLLVLGHSRCGAVSAAASGERATGAIEEILERIRPAVRASEAVDGGRVDGAAREHARRTAGELCTRSHALREAVSEGRLVIVAGFYDLTRGSVEFL